MKKLAQMISDFSYQNGKDIKQVLDDLLTYIIANFNPYPKPDPHWSYTKDQNRMFYDMMGEYFRVMEEQLRHKEWFDAWGDLFMELTPKGGARGQFFTPPHLCDLMAKTQVDTERLPDKPCGGFGKRITINDPAAGSSRNLLSAHARFIHDGKPKPYLIAEDVDLMCCKMSAVNMMAHGCFGEVVCHNTLSSPKDLNIGYIVNEGMYPIQPGFPTIRVSFDRKDFITTKGGVNDT